MNDRFLSQFSRYMCLTASAPDLVGKGRVELSQVRVRVWVYYHRSEATTTALSFNQALFGLASLLVVLFRKSLFHFFILFYSLLWIFRGFLSFKKKSFKAFVWPERVKLLLPMQFVSYSEDFSVFFLIPKKFKLNVLGGSGGCLSLYFSCQLS